VNGYSWKTGRQNVVWALEKIAVWRELFSRAARLLTNLALGENSNNSNNSRGVLKAWPFTVVVLPLQGVYNPSP
jgi:hypothetical protein